MMSYPRELAAGHAPARRKQVYEERSARKRQAVVEAATELFARRGYCGTSMDQISIFASVSKATAYRFYPDKEQLLTEIVMEALDRSADPLAEQLASLGGTGNLPDDMRRLARDYLATVTHPSVLQLRRVVADASYQHPDLAQTYYERVPERTLRALADCFKRLAGEGLLRIPDPERAAAHFAFLVLGNILDKNMFCGDPSLSSEELAAQADAGAEAFLTVYAKG